MPITNTELMNVVAFDPSSVSILAGGFESSVPNAATWRIYNSTTPTIVTRFYGKVDGSYSS